MVVYWFLNLEYKSIIEKNSRHKSVFTEMYNGIRIISVSKALSFCCFQEFNSCFN